MKVAYYSSIGDPDSTHTRRNADMKLLRLHQHQQRKNNMSKLDKGRWIY